MTSHKNLFFKRAYVNSQWQNDVRIQIADSGLIANVEANSEPAAEDEVLGTGIPGMPNIHSHAFQRVMAGLSEYKLPKGDNFWTWRELMYRFANQISAESLESIAAQLYVEMVKSGYTGVGEFHYVHHQRAGEPFDQVAELSNSIINAAELAGINLTLLPVAYLNSGFGGKPVSDEQLRFANTIEGYLELLQSAQTLVKASPRANMGMAFHSLRAVAPQAMNEILLAFNDVSSGSPIHIHIAEQTKEVDDCVAWSSKRPVEWLLENHEVNEHWCLVHATHLTQVEIKGIADSGATVGLCPTTEANLGDGLFPLEQFLQAGGSIAIGSDSNTSVSPVEEIRLLEYGQRLFSQARNVGATTENLHTGTSLLDKCLAGGARALGRQAGVLGAGYQADIVVLDDASLSFAATPSEFAFDTYIFAGSTNIVSDVMVSGEWQVRDYKHKNEDQIKANFFATIASLRA